MGADTNTQIKWGLTDALLSATDDAARTRVKKALGLIEEFSFHKAAADAMAADESELWIAKVTKKIQFSSVSLISAAALTAHADNNATISLEVDDGAGGANTVIASVVTTAGGSGNWTAGTAEALTLSGTPANLVVDGATATKYLILKIVKTGDGVVVPIFTLFATAELVD